ncbi:MAG: flagellar basal-body MS-ring/collar protein FliF [Gemmatimonadota bacterium]
MANQMVQQMTGAVRRMNGPRRVVIIGGSALVLIAVVMVALWAAEPAWVPLYKDISLADAGRMVDALDKAGVRSKLNADGSEIMVGASDRARARVLLAKEQLPMTGRPGFELFDTKADWGMTDFAQRIMYQRALEGELSRTISTTDGVERAEVHITIPEAGVLRRLDRPAKAAVVLKIKRGATLAPGAVQGVIAMVSNSVDRLSADNIAVTDETGRLLSGASAEGAGFGATAHRIEMQRSVEQYLGLKAEQMLQSVSGLGKPQVQIAATLNFDQVERTIETFDPDAQVLQSEGRSETEAPADGTGAQTIVNNTYQNSRKLEKIVSSGSGITRLTVAVMVDERAMVADTTSQTPRTERLASVESLVKNAIGFDSARGDRITVTAVPLQVPAVDTTSLQAIPRDIMVVVERFSRPAIGLVAIIVMLVLALKGMKAVQSSGMSSQSSLTTSRTRGELPPGLESEVAPLGPTPEVVLLRNRVVAETTERPELMAQVVRAWMSEG